MPFEMFLFALIWGGYAAGAAFAAVIVYRTIVGLAVDALEANMAPARYYSQSADRSAVIATLAQATLVALTGCRTRQQLRQKYSRVAY